jgi:hypothetical protein
MASSFQALIRTLSSPGRALLAVVLLSVTLAGCGESQGQECDPCVQDADCTTGGLVCVPFSDGTKHCGSGIGATQCRKPLL